MTDTTDTAVQDVPEFTEGICGDEVLILCDGQRMSTSNILALLNAGAVADASVADLEKRLRYTEEALIAATDLHGAELKAERQRADDLQGQLELEQYRSKTLSGTVDTVDGQRDHWMERARKAESELAALKGDQVPYGYAFEDRVGREQFQRTRPVLAQDHRVTIVELFTAPQKPVVLPEGFYPDGDIDCELVINLSDAIAAIEAAGGKVAE